VITNQLAKSKLQLYRAVCASSPGTEAHLSGIRAFHRAAWECFASRHVDPPQQKTEYVFTTQQGDSHNGKLPRAAEKPTVDPRTKKAILSLERDCEFCWDELQCAIAAWDNGTRAKIRAIDALSKWRKDYDARWQRWLARGRKKLPTGLQRLREFADAHGQVHFVGGEEGYFATAKDAQRLMQATEMYRKADDTNALYHSETNQRLMELYDRAQDDPALWDELDKALKQADAEDGTRNEDEDTQESESNDESEA
jgi:hypothetical protein